MSIGKIRFLLVLALMSLLGAVFAEASHKSLHNFPLSGETLRAAAECRREPTEARREALRRHVARDFDRYVAEQRRKFKHHHVNRHRLEKMLRERDRCIEETVSRLLEGEPPAAGGAPAGSGN